MAETLTGAVGTDGGTAFRIWAPESRRVEIVVEGGGEFSLAAEGNGWFSGMNEEAGVGTRYRLRLDGESTYPDPWSRSQPEGVHGPSEVVDLGAYEWQDSSWRGIRAADLVIYEVHVGTATEAGTFDGLRERLPYLVDLGVTAVELMPVSEFPGRRNWGYDGVYLFAPSSSYGGPRALQRFVDAAHGHGLAVLLDVVYNHFGPEGNYLPAVTGGRIFTERHHTPWGAAVNYDDAGSDAVRLMVLENVRQWIRDYRIDGLRLDAAHAIVDDSHHHILEEIAAAARDAAAGRDVVVIAEDERNERRLLLPAAEGGYGLDGVWADDAHHVIRRLTAGDSDGYYAAYEGTAHELAATLQRGWLYEGAHYEPTGESRGTPAAGLPPEAFVHCIQNHDQVGNRALGERLHHDIGLDVYRAVSALLLLTPYTPLLWMGQEWAATSPFLYFTDHPEELGRLVTEGRRDEFRRFARFSDPAMRQQIPDPQAEDTFTRSRLRWDEISGAPHAGVLALYRDLLGLRRNHPALQQRRRDTWRAAAAGDGVLTLHRAGADGGSLLLVVAFSEGQVVALDLDDTAGPAAGGRWRLLLDTEAEGYGGRGGAGTLKGNTLTVVGPGSVLLAPS
ncbi:MAG TPA: malto-oligosyltrehalose trehalohydrolase [Longimicrobiales bacterium]|nr:malto-oligosyltrehalose trehalohydrolase [Longimicrobiales bacterium]